MTTHVSTLSLDQAAAKIAELEAKLAAANKPRALSFKVGQAGGVSVYGLGRWPTTLYASQWAQLFAHRAEIEAFIKQQDAAGNLAKKG